MPPKEQAHAGEAIGFTLTDELYVRPGEIMCKTGEKLASTSSRFRANVFWMGKASAGEEQEVQVENRDLARPGSSG